MSSETNPLSSSSSPSSRVYGGRKWLLGARHGLRKNVHQQKEYARNAEDLNGIKETKIYTVSEEISAPAVPPPAKDTEREPAPVEKPTASPGSPGGRNYSPSEKPLIPEFGPLEHALYELQSCPSISTRINVSLRREGEQQNVAVNSRIKAMPAMIKGPDEKTMSISAREFGPLERILRELRNYSTPIQSMNIDASLYRKGSERKITVQSKTSDLLPERYSVSSSTEANKFWKPWAWGPGASLTAAVSLALAGYVASYFLSGRIAGYVSERVNQPQLYHQEKLPSPPTSFPAPYKKTHPHEQELASPGKHLSRGEQTCLKSFQQLYTGTSSSSAAGNPIILNASTIQQAITGLVTACRDRVEISKVLAAGKEQVHDYFNFPEIAFDRNGKNDPRAEEWKKSFQQLFGEKAILYSGNSDTYQWAVHMGYTPVRLDPLLQKIVHRAGIPTDKEQAEYDFIPTLVERKQLREEERRRLALLPSLETALFFGGKTLAPPVVKIYSALHNELGEPVENIIGYHDFREPATIYLSRDCLQNEECFIKTYTHERGHQVTKGRDHQDSFRKFFENLGYLYLRQEVFGDTLRVTATHGRKRDKGG